MTTTGKVSSITARGLRKLMDPTNSIIEMNWSEQNTRTIMDQSTMVNTQDRRANAKRSVFQQRWKAKRMVRAYHFSHITEKQFLGRHFQSVLPLQQIQSKKLREQIPPIQTLMFAEMERRVDVVVYRAHFAQSIGQARSAVVKGFVLVNGEICKNPFHRLNDGDLVTVHPNVIPSLKNVNYPSFRLGNTFSTFRTVPAHKVKKPVPKPDAGDITKPGEFNHIKYMDFHMFVPNYLEVNYATCTVAFLRSPLPQPNRVEIPMPFPPEVYQLAFEWYARIQRRKTISRVHDREKRIVLRMSKRIPRVIRLKPRFRMMVTREWRKRRGKFIKESQKREMWVDVTDSASEKMAEEETNPNRLGGNERRNVRSIRPGSSVTSKQ